MAIHRYESWGRTRRPKNLNGSTSTAEVALTSTNGSAPTGSSAGYSTENQRYLHFMMRDTSNTDEDTSVSIYVYHHAFANWSLLLVPLAQAGSSATSPSSAYAPATFLAERDQHQTIVLEIAGADRVAFVADNSDSVAVFAAGSTF